MTKSPTSRSKARYARASCVLAPLPLDSEHSRALSRLLASRRCTVAQLLRDLLREECSRLDPDYAAQKDE